jgi:hypothetical protein
LLEPLTNEETLYFANVTLGTPGQSLRLDIDTGSSDLWTNSARSGLCQQYAQACGQSGTYNANKSSTYSYVNSDFIIQYADGSAAAGDYATDTLGIGGAQIQGVQFGIGYDSSSPQGILGIGYAANEASIPATGKSYSNLPEVLVNQKIINTMAYSLWLNDLDANEGSILFGGVDTDKYHGTLATVPIIQEQGQYREFVVAMSSFVVANQTVSTSPIPVLLDSGSSLSYLPSSYAQAVFAIFSAQYDANTGAAVVDCNLMNADATVDFGFSGLTISVEMSELVIIDGYRHNQPVCILGISDAGESTAVLGDTFLRSAYVVYDLSNNEISIAQTNFNSTTSSVKEISAGSSGVPGASTVTSAVSTLTVTTGGARNPGLPSVTAVKTGNFGVPVAMPVGLHHGKLAAILAAGVGTGFALIL